MDYGLPAGDRGMMDRHGLAVRLDAGVVGRGDVTARRPPRAASTLTGAAGVRIDAAPRTWYFALGLAIAGCVAIASVVARIADLGGGGGPQAAHDAGVADSFHAEREVMVSPMP